MSNQTPPDPAPSLQPQQPYAANAKESRFQSRVLIWLRRLFSLSLLLLCAWAAWNWHQDLSQSNQSQRSLYMLVIGCSVYYVCLVTPFLPGVELGLGLMMLYGWQGVLAVYLTTQLGLNTAYWIGRLWRHPWQDRLVQRIDSEQLPRALRWCTQKIRFHPALALIFLLNLPGNAILGGGGGLSMLYGLLKFLSPLRFLLAALAASSPAPLFFLLYPIFNS